MKTLEQFIKENNGKQVEVTGSANAKFQCVDLANAYIRDVLGFPIVEWTNAVDFPKKCLPPNYEYVLNSATGFPLKGDIVIWSSKDNIGHIAICVEDGNTKNFKSFDQNWSKPLYCTLETHTYTGTNHNVVGWLKPKSSIIISDMTTDGKNALGLLESYKINAKHSNLEGAMNALIGSVTSLKNATESIKNFENTVKALEAQLEAVNSKVGELEAKFIENQKELKTCQTAIQTANKKILEQDKMIEKLTTESNDWQKRYNNKNTEFNDLTTTFNDLSKLFEEYKKCNPQTETKTTLIKNIINFIKSLFKK
jgi:hypothetical protein